MQTSLLIDSDRESNKSDDSDTAKQQNMYIWNRKYEVSIQELSQLHNEIQLPCAGQLAQLANL